jgi:hypothetical protein
MHEQMTQKDRSRSTIFLIVLALDTFVVGGFVAFLIVNRLLNIQLGIYAQHIDAASVIIDFIDDLFPYHLTYYVAMAVLAVLTVVVWTWSKPQSRVLRYAAVLLLLVLVSIGAWLSLGSRAPVTFIPPLMTPTPVVPSGG